MPHIRETPAALAGADRGLEVVGPGGVDTLQDTLHQASVQRRAVRLRHRLALRRVPAVVIAEALGVQP